MMLIKLLRMNTKLITFLIFFFTLFVKGQGGGEEDFYAGELSKMVNIPNSPEAQAFVKYGDTKVNMYAGVPEINIPLHTISGREMSVPLSLTYDASGVQVEQMATWAGLSWNLNAGGRISRTVNGLPDDYLIGAYQSNFNNSNIADLAQTYIADKANTLNPTFTTEENAKDYVRFLFDVNYNFIDTQQDFFNLNVMGLNEIIVFDSNQLGNKPKVLNNPRIKVEAFTNGIRGTAGTDGTLNISGWLITNEDGTQYFFEETEITKRQNLDYDGTVPMGDANTEYVSSWLLTKVISKNNKDIFEFGHKDEGFEPLRSFAQSAGVATTKILNQVAVYPEPQNGQSSAVVSANRQKFLTTIIHNQDTMAVINFADRLDVALNPVTTRLESIAFFDNMNNPLKSITFENNDYFNRDGIALTDFSSNGKSYHDIRLKLNGISIKGKDNTTYQNYQFEYSRPDDVPSRDSFAQDYFGYYNGAESNSSLYIVYEDSGLRFDGANREPDSFYGRTGMLNKVTYPTGGNTLYAYESHEIHKTVINESPNNPLSITLNLNSVTDPDLYPPSGGVEVCEDQFQELEPKVVIRNINIVQEGGYTINYENTSGEAFLIDSDQATGPLDDYCDFVRELGTSSEVWHSSVSTPRTETLSVGQYTVLLLLAETPNPTINQGASLSLSGPPIVTVSDVNVPIGGNRISRITDFSEDKTTSVIKSYSYNDSLGKSTGGINYKPVLIDMRTGDTQNGETNELLRYATYAKGSEPYVVYCAIDETRIDKFGNAQGKTTFTHFGGTTKGIVPNTSAPYENRYVPSLKIGNIKSRDVFNETGEDVLKEEFDYYENNTSAPLIKGLVAYSDENNFEKTIFIKINDEGPGATYYSLDYLPTWSCSGVGCAVPDYILNPQNYGYASFMNPKYSPYRGRIITVQGVNGGPFSSKTASYFKDDTNTVVTVSSEESTSYDQGPGSLYLPQRKRMTDSKGEEYETNYYYAFDESGPGYDALFAKNNLAEVVKSETFKDPDAPNPKLISERSNTYSAATSGGVFPTRVSTRKSVSSDEERIEFGFYGNGNLQTAKKSKGPNSVYIWGYDDLYPIAKIENADYATVTQYVANLETLSNADNDRTQGSNGQEGALRDALNNMRNALPNAMVTTYTYDPAIGVTSITDPKGYTIYYNYDAFNRLKDVRDAAGALVTDYEYNYKNQQ